jgi:hypothetical protein
MYCNEALQKAMDNKPDAYAGVINKKGEWIEVFASFEEARKYDNDKDVIVIGKVGLYVFDVNIR